MKTKTIYYWVNDEFAGESTAVMLSDMLGYGRTDISNAARKGRIIVYKGNSYKFSYEKEFYKRVKYQIA
jgi:hypothetical protein